MTEQVVDLPDQRQQIKSKLLDGGLILFLIQ